MIHDSQVRSGAVALERQLRDEGVPSVLTLRAASEVAQKSPDALARLARAGVLRASRSPSTVGRGHWRITRRALAEYLAGDCAEVA